MNTFQPPKNAVVHFDGKHLTDLSGKFGDRLAVVLSGNTPDCLEGKLLSADLIASSSGDCQANKVVETLEKWGVVDSVKGICMDTTLSNTGKYQGACVLIEKLLDRSLLWLPGRHHISELFVKAAWEKLFGKDMDRPLE